MPATLLQPAVEKQATYHKPEMPPRLASEYKAVTNADAHVRYM
jgi:hypothetical protein